MTDAASGQRTVHVQVWAHKWPCFSCGHEFWWVAAVVGPPSDFHRTTDRDLPIAVARHVLASRHPGSWAAALLEQMAPRPTWQRGTGYNPNVCPRCQEQAEWHDFDQVLSAVQRGSGGTPAPPARIAAEGRVPGRMWWPLMSSST